MTVSTSIPQIEDVKSDGLRAELERIAALTSSVEQVRAWAEFIDLHDTAVRYARHQRNLDIVVLRRDEHLSREEIARLADCSVAQVAACMGGRVRGL